MPEPTTHPLLARGQEALKTGQLPYAIECFTQVLGDQPGSLEARRGLRQATRTQAEAQPSGGLTALTRKLGALPHLLRAQLAAGRKDWTQAASAYDAALRQSPLEPAWLYRLGRTLLAQGQEPAAIETLEESVQLNPNFLPASRQLAELYLKRGDDQHARACFERILKAVPHDIQAERGLKNLDAMGTIRKSFGAPGDSPR